MIFRFDKLDNSLVYFYNLEIHLDKLKHFLISLLIFLVIFYVRKFIIKSKGNLRVVSYTIRDVIIIGLFKEFIDLFGFGHPELADLLADSLGIFIAIYLFYIIRETKKIEESKLFKYEIKLINQLKVDIFSLFKNAYVLIKIKYLQTFFKRRIMIAIEKRIVRYYFRNSFKNFSKIFKIFVLYSFVWIINLLYLLVKIPFLALYDTFEIFAISFDFAIKKINNLKI